MASFHNEKVIRFQSAGYKQEYIQLDNLNMFEVLIGNIIDRYYNDGKAGNVRIDKMGQFAENKYFGKESRWMDQRVSSVGGCQVVSMYINSFPCPTADLHYIKKENTGLIEAMGLAVLQPNQYAFQCSQYS